MRTNKMSLKSLTLGVLGLMMSSAVLAANVVESDNLNSVDNVHWQKLAGVNAGKFYNHATPNNMASVYFIREADTDPVQTSVNISINERFLTSLQPGNYSHSYVCVGNNTVAAATTGAKHNDLAFGNTMLEFKGGANYFYYVKVDGGKHVNISQIDEKTAISLLKNSNQQSHQISRVTPDCPAAPAPEPMPAPVYVPAPTPAPAYVPPPPPAPVQNTMTTELVVHFDTDKSVIKSHEKVKAKELAKFMQENPDSTAVVQGHADSMASTQYNKALSVRRANAVKNLLVKKYGISASRIETVGYGESRPVATNKTSQGRKANRRVVVVVTY